MKFIHTLSLRRFCEKDEIDALKDNYDKKSFFYVGKKDYDERRKNAGKRGYKGEEGVWILNPYVYFGLRVVIRPLPNDSKERSIYKHLFEMIVYVTPMKLLNPGVSLGGLTGKDEIEKACNQLKELVKVIEEKSDVNILSDTVLWRVDLTKDQLTPSDLYSHEVIRALKKSINKRGYKLHLHEMLEDDYNISWYPEDSILFNNENQGVGGKVYNKKRDLALSKCYSEVEQIGENGLLRFELSLLHQRLKDDYGAAGEMTSERLAEILWAVTNDASKLFDTYFSQVFYPGGMVSREVMKAWIKREYPGKEQQSKKMLDYSDFATGKRVKGKKKSFTETKVRKRKKEFNEIAISPVSVCKECPYIPSVADLIEDRVDTKLLKFAEKKTAWHLEFLYWENNYPHK